MNELLDCSASVFYMIRRFLHGEIVFYDDFKTAVERGFNEFKEKAEAKQLSVMAIEETQYALSALIDEMVLSSDVESKKAWSTSSLQQKYFHENTSGKGFFDRLQELRKSPLENQFILEMYYLCLELGFKGKYIAENEQALRLAFIGGLKSQLSLVQKPMEDYLIGQDLIEEAVEYTPSRRKWWDGVSNTAMIVASLIISGLIFVFAHWPLDFQ